MSMFIGYLHCARCAYRTDTFLCLYHHWRGGYGVPVQDQETLAIRLVHVPDDPVFYTDDSGLSEADAEKAIEDYVASVLAGGTSRGEKAIPVVDLLFGKPVEAPCPDCRAPLAWCHTGIT